MGYNTQLEGRVEISPPLNAAEVSYLQKFNQARHCMRGTGPYDVSEVSSLERHNHRDWSNRTYPDKPDFYCPWVPTEDGTALVWDGGEKSYGMTDWMEYLIYHFLRPDAIASRPMLLPAWKRPFEFDLFTWNHSLTGGFHAQGDEMGDVWTLLVRDNVVSRVTGHKPLPPSGIDWTKPEDVVAAREAALAPAREAMDSLRYDYPEVDPQHMLDVILSVLVGAGYTVTAPDGKTQVDAPF